MSKLSEHTKQVNLCLSFIRESGNWPTPLDNAGYSLQSVLPNLINSNDKPVRPDLLLGSNFRQNVLVVDCEDGEPEAGKLDGLDALDVDDLLREISNLDPSNLSKETTILGNADTGIWIDAENVDVPSIIVRGDRYERKNEFNDDSLNNNITDTRLPSMKPPVSYFPFGPSDDKERIAYFISQELVKKAANGEGSELDIDAKELLKDMFDCWESITDDQKDQLQRKATAILDLFSKEDVEGNMRKIDQRTYYVNSCQALERKFESVINELSETDTTIGDFT